MKALAAAHLVRGARRLDLARVAEPPTDRVHARTETSIDLMRVSGLAIAIGILTVAVVWMAVAPRRLAGRRRSAIGAAGVLTVVGAGRRPELPTAVVIVTNAAWLAGAAAVAAAIVASPRFANVPRRPSAVLLAMVGGSGIAAAVLGGGSGLGATIGVAAVDGHPGRAHGRCSPSTSCC